MQLSVFLLLEYTTDIKIRKGLHVIDEAKKQKMTWLCAGCYCMSWGTWFCKLTLHHAKLKPHINNIQKSWRLLRPKLIGDKLTQSGKVRCGLTSPHFSLFLEVMDVVSSGLKRKRSVQNSAKHLWWCGAVLVSTAWTTWTSVKALFMIKGAFRFQSNICCLPDDVFSYSCQTMQGHTIQQRGFTVKECTYDTGPPALQTGPSLKLNSWSHKSSNNGKEFHFQNNGNWCPQFPNTYWVLNMKRFKTCCRHHIQKERVFTKKLISLNISDLVFCLRVLHGVPNRLQSGLNQYAHTNNWSALKQTLTVHVSASGVRALVLMWSSGTNDVTLTK